MRLTDAKKTRGLWSCAVPELQESTICMQVKKQMEADLKYLHKVQGSGAYSLTELADKLLPEVHFSPRKAGLPSSGRRPAVLQRTAACIAAQGLYTGTLERGELHVVVHSAQLASQARCTACGGLSACSAGALCMNVTKHTERSSRVGKVAMPYTGRI